MLLSFIPIVVSVVDAKPQPVWTQMTVHAAPMKPPPVTLACVTATIMAIQETTTHHIIRMYNNREILIF